MSVTGRIGRFFFASVDPHAAAVMRISLGLLLVGSHLLLWPDVDTLMGPDAAIGFDAVQGWSRDWRATWYAWVDHGWQAHLLHALGLVPMVLFTVGWGTQTMAWLSLLVQVFVHHRMPWIQHGGDRLLRLWTLYMALVPCGAALSLDARRRGNTHRLPPPVSRVAHRLIQAQLCLVYAVTAWEKLKGRQWMDGTALYYAIASPHFQRIPALSEAVIQNGIGQVLLALGTWMTLAWEVLFVPLVLFRKTRPVVLVLGVAVHAGIFLLMTVGSFSPASLWAYLSFVDDRALGARVRGWLQGPVAETAN